VKLAVFYAFVALAYLALLLAAPRAAEALFPFVALLLLIPAVYAEVLRVRSRSRR
jgi:hypothetical protein